MPVYNVSLVITANPKGKYRFGSAGKSAVYFLKITYVKRSTISFCQICHYKFQDPALSGAIASTSSEIRTTVILFY